MKEMTLDEVKDVSLDILDHIHNFCVENGLHYSMWGGSLIGVIRHHGYIPWDDDIDLCMTRPDFDRFFEIYKDSEDYAAFSYKRNGALIEWGRVCDMKRTEGYSLFPWTSKKTGVYVSIFPIDGVESNLDVFMNRFDLNCTKSAETYRLKRLYCSPTKYFSLRTNLSLIKNKLFHLTTYLSSHRKTESLIHDLCMDCEKCDYTKSEYVCDVSYANVSYRPKHLWPKEDFEEYVIKDFEGHPAMVIKGYDRNLRLRFGDYMKMPPKEQQIAKHGHTNYYWI